MQHADSLPKIRMILIVRGCQRGKSVDYFNFWRGASCTSGENVAYSPPRTWERRSLNMLNRPLSWLLLRSTLITSRVSRSRRKNRRNSEAKRFAREVVVMLTIVGTTLPSYARADSSTIPPPCHGCTSDGVQPPHCNENDPTPPGGQPNDPTKGGPPPAGGPPCDDGNGGGGGGGGGGDSDGVSDSDGAYSPYIDVGIFPTDGFPFNGGTGNSAGMGRICGGGCGFVTPFCERSIADENDETVGTGSCYGPGNRADTIGDLGANWALPARPSIRVFNTTIDSVSTQYIKLFMGTNKMLTFILAGTSPNYVYRGINGTQGAVVRKLIEDRVTSESSLVEVEVFEYHALNGNVYSFFGTAGFDTGVKGQLWKIETCDADGSVTKRTYTGHPTNPVIATDLTQAHPGFESVPSGPHRVKTMYDAEGRRMTYTYSSISTYGHLDGSSNLVVDDTQSRLTSLLYEEPAGGGHVGKRQEACLYVLQLRESEGHPWGRSGSLAGKRVFASAAPLRLLVRRRRAWLCGRLGSHDGSELLAGRDQAVQDSALPLLHGVL